jgi:hypothetical protein
MPYKDPEHAREYMHQWNKTHPGHKRKRMLELKRVAIRKCTTKEAAKVLYNELIGRSQRPVKK